MAQLTIGKLAQAAGVNIETIRYYQRRGLLVEPTKPMGGHRRYTSEQANRVRFIKRAQALGFTLTEISKLLTLNQGCCDETSALATRKLELIKQKITDLDVMRQALEGLVQQCKTGKDRSSCPIIDALIGSLD